MLQITATTTVCMLESTYLAGTVTASTLAHIHTQRHAHSHKNGISAEQSGRLVYL